MVHNRAGTWAGWNCVRAQEGNICKCVVKVPLMIRQDIAEDTIARFLSKQTGNANGGMGRFLSPLREEERNNFVPTPVPTPKQTPSKRQFGQMT